MVGITVILAAVIGGFVLGLGGDLQLAQQAHLESGHAVLAAGNKNPELSLGHDYPDVTSLVRHLLVLCKLLKPALPSIPLVDADALARTYDLAGKRRGRSRPTGQRVTLPT